MLHLPTTLITEAALQQLVYTACPESPTLDFKRVPPGNSDKDKQELCKDVTALANGDGGDIVYGMDEADGVASALVPITSESADTLQLRIVQTLDALVEPRIQGLQFATVPVAGGFIFLVRVPASFDGPHCTLTNGRLRRFVMRNGTTTTDLNFLQLRAAFDRTARLTEAAQAFIADRQQRALIFKFPRPMRAGPLLTLNFVPLSGIAGRQKVDIRQWERNLTRLLTLSGGSAGSTFNLDGFVVYQGQRGQYDGYLQVFRNGCFEAARYAGAVGSEYLPCTHLAIWLRETLGKLINIAKESGINGPVLVGTALHHIEGYHWARAVLPFPEFELKADRPHLVLPLAWIEDLSSLEQIDAILRPLLDLLWQSFGIPECNEYDADGTWKHQ